MFLIMSAETFEEYSKKLPSVIYALADPHVKASGGRMDHLEWSPDVWGFQKPECSVWDSEYVVPTAQERAPIAKTFLAEYPIIFKSLINDAQSSEVLHKAGEALEQGKNVALITPHKDVIDIGVALLAGKDAIEYHKRRAHRTGIILSKMLAGIEYTTEFVDSSGEKQTGSAPVVSALSLLCDNVYMTWPRTASARAHTYQLPKTEVDRNNQEAIAALHDHLDEGGDFLGLASTGTTQADCSEGGYVKLPGLSAGTIAIMKRPDTLLLPMLVSLDPVSPKVWIPGGLSSPETEEGVLGFMADLERNLNR